MNQKDVSIVICTHRRLKLLRSAIQSMIKQNAPADIFEVIVVDNDIMPNQGIQKAVFEAGKKISIRYIHESRIGLSHARNSGGQNAYAEYVSYIDDDSQADPLYIQKLVEIIVKEKPAIFGGPYYPFYLEKKPIWYLDEYGSSSKGDVARYLNSKEYLSGTNIIFRKSLLEKLGWFNPNLGVSGKKLWYGEETQMIIEARNKFPDLRIFYDPGLVIYHLVPSWKMSAPNMLKIAFNRGRSHAYLWMNDPRHAGIPYYALRNLAIKIAYLFVSLGKGIFLRDRTRYPYLQNYFVEEFSPHVHSLGIYSQLLKDCLFKSQ